MYTTQKYKDKTMQGILQELAKKHKLTKHQVDAVVFSRISFLYTELSKYNKTEEHYPVVNLKGFGKFVVTDRTKTLIKLRRAKYEQAIKDRRASESINEECATTESI